MRADEGARVRALRLEGLLDPVAPLAFLETYEAATARPAEFWSERAASAAAGTSAAQFVATRVGADGSEQWLGTVTALREEPGAVDWAGALIAHDQAQVVGVWVHPDHRGAGLLARLVDEVAAWASAYGAERLRLLVHEGNGRARAAYRKIGFTPSGVVVPLAVGNELELVRPLA